MSLPAARARCLLAEQRGVQRRSRAVSEAASNEVSSPGGSPGETANASVYEGDEAETLEDLMAAR